MVPPPKLSRPGLALARATNSATVLGPSARTASTETVLVVSVIGAKSLKGS